jgi:bacterioferritin
VPNLQRLSPLRVGETVPEQLRLDLALEGEAIPRLNRAVAAATAAGDNGSRELFEAILVDEEEHADWLEAQLTLIEQVGEANYLAQQIHG